MKILPPPAPRGTLFYPSATFSRRGLPGSPGGGEDQKRTKKGPLKIDVHNAMVGGRPLRTNWSPEPRFRTYFYPCPSQDDASLASKLPQTNNH